MNVGDFNGFVKVTNWTILKLSDEKKDHIV